MPATPSPELLHQQRLIAALCKVLPPPVEIEETHISWVLLTGTQAYKIKKNVNLGFLDFSDLEARHFYCNEELRLNRRLAPKLYLDVITIGGSLEQPHLGSEPALEYAVHMRRFDRGDMLDSLLARGQLAAAHIDRLAARIANFHASLPPAPADSPYVELSTIQEAAEQNFAHLDDLHHDLPLLAATHEASTNEFSARKPLFHQRAATGCIRECHGDLHLGNIVLLDGEPTPFDCIEFSATLRWIDTLSEISFTVMDLLQRNQPQLAWRLLNAYLEHRGEYSGSGVLRFYLGYRAMVRAKIAAIRANQENPTAAAAELDSCRSYLALAHACLTRRQPALIITHGLPGSGKSMFAQLALEHLGAIRLRSDVERKRLFGLNALASSKALADIYSADATRRTYDRLRQLAHDLLDAGFPVIVDAAFLKHAERTSFRALAQQVGVPFIIASLKTGEGLLSRRLEQRNGSDASEADVAVMQKLRAVQEPLRDEERPVAVTFSNNGDAAALRGAIESNPVLSGLLHCAAANYSSTG